MATVYQWFIEDAIFRRLDFVPYLTDNAPIFSSTATPSDKPDYVIRSKAHARVGGS